MKNLFLFLLATLVVFSQAMTLSLSRRGPGGPSVLYWGTDLSTTREEQVQAFSRWREARGLPPVEVRIDPQNRGLMKAIVQGVSGTADDLINLNGTAVQYLNAVGTLNPVADLEKRYGYPDSALWAGVSNDLFQDGQQVGFPASLNPMGWIINVDAVKKVGLESPPFDMGIDAFEAWAQAYVDRANRGLKHRLYFAVDTIDPVILLRSAGITLFNETSTAAALPPGPTAALLKRWKGWTTDRHFMPSQADRESLTAESGVMGGAVAQYFAKGYLASFYNNRWISITLRTLGFTGEIKTVLPPHAGIPTAFGSVSTVVMYRNSRQPQAAIDFLGFLRSPEYSRLLIQQGENLPPDTGLLREEALLRPVGHTNEWGFHQGLVNLMDRAVGREYSPYVLHYTIETAFSKLIESLLQGLLSPEEFPIQASALINGEIAKYLVRYPEKRPAFDSALERQKSLDLRKARGETIPPGEIENPVFRKLMEEKAKRRP